MSKHFATLDYKKEFSELKKELSDKEIDIIDLIIEIICEFKSEASWFKTNKQHSRYVLYSFMFPFTINDAMAWAANGQNFVKDFTALASPEEWKNQIRRELWYRCCEKGLDKNIPNRQGIIVMYVLDENDLPHLLSIYQSKMDEKSTIF